ncbi:MAG: Fe-S cluster assembly protein SufD [Chloroflexi bacterium]|nr:Fe-S cluster assembly protein SufD [Chloroflexota bacterium]
MPKQVVVRRGTRRRTGPHLTFGPEAIVATHPAVRAWRQEAWEIFSALPWPTTQDEPWRRTNIRRMPSPAALAQGREAPEPTPDLLRALADEAPAGELVLHGPRLHLRRVDPALEAQGVLFLDLRTAEAQHGDLLADLLGQVVPPAEGKFAALAHALAQNGVLVYVPAGVHLERPLHALLWGPGENVAHFDHVLVWLEEGASATVIVEWASPNQQQPSLHAGVMEVHVAARADLRLVELQSWGEHVWHFSHERVKVHREAQANWIFGSVGSRLLKSFMEIDLVEEGAEGYMSGFYFADDHQHMDHDTQQNHLAPHTTSDLLFKGALKDTARSVWQGMIYVAPEAQHTDGYQANRNLILSEGARADSIPGLEIMANEVRCTHGATLGRVDDEQVFYLRTRGLSESEAKRIIVEGFFDEVLQRIPFEGVRERFREVVHEKMSRGI